MICIDTNYLGLIQMTEQRKLQQRRGLLAASTSVPAVF